MDQNVLLIKVVNRKKWSFVNEVKILPRVPNEIQIAFHQFCVYFCIFHTFLAQINKILHQYDSLRLKSTFKLCKMMIFLYLVKYFVKSMNCVSLYVISQFHVIFCLETIRQLFRNIFLPEIDFIVSNGWFVRIF